MVSTGAGGGDKIWRACQWSVVSCQLLGEGPQPGRQPPLTTDNGPLTPQAPSPPIPSGYPKNVASAGTHQKVGRGKANIGGSGLKSGDGDADRDEQAKREVCAGSFRPIPPPCVAALQTYNPGMFLLQGRSPVRNRVARDAVARDSDGKDSVAGVAQLVEHDVANVVVVGSNPITRSWIAVSYRLSAVSQRRLSQLAGGWQLSADRFNCFIAESELRAVSRRPGRVAYLTGRLGA